MGLDVPWFWPLSLARGSTLARLDALKKNLAFAKAVHLMQVRGPAPTWSTSTQIRPDRSEPWQMADKGYLPVSRQLARQPQTKIIANQDRRWLVDLDVVQALGRNSGSEPHKLFVPFLPSNLYQFIH